MMMEMKEVAAGDIVFSFILLFFLFCCIFFDTWCMLGASLEQALNKHGEVLIVHFIARWLVELQLIPSPHVVMQNRTTYYA
jgi:hypothetical protein